MCKVSEDYPYMLLLPAIDILWNPSGGMYMHCRVERGLVLMCWDLSSCQAASFRQLPVCLNKSLKAAGLRAALLRHAQRELFAEGVYTELS